MNAQEKLIDLIGEGKISVEDAERLLKAMNSNEKSNPRATKKASAKKRVKIKKKAVKKKKIIRKKAVKTIKPLISIKKGSAVQMGPDGNLIVDGKPVGEDDSNRPYQKNKDGTRRH